MRKGSVLGSSPTRRTGPGTEQKSQKTPQTTHEHKPGPGPGKKENEQPKATDRPLDVFHLGDRFWGRYPSLDRAVLGSAPEVFRRGQPAFASTGAPGARDHCRATGPRVYKSPWNPRPLQGNRPPCLQKFLDRRPREWRLDHNVGRRRFC